MMDVGDITKDAVVPPRLPRRFRSGFIFFSSNRHKEIRKERVAAKNQSKVSKKRVWFGELLAITGDDYLGEIRTRETQAG